MAVSLEVSRYNHLSRDVKGLILQKLETKSLMNWTVAGPADIDLNYEYLFKDGKGVLSRMYDAASYSNVCKQLERLQSRVKKIAVSFSSSYAPCSGSIQNDNLYQIHQCFLSLLRQCHALQSLKIEVHEYWHDTDFSSLPPNLTHLTLKKCGARQVDFSTFSRLTSLDLDWVPRALPALVSLRLVDVKTIISAATIKAWPPTLLSLKMTHHDLSDEHLEALPRNLTYLEIRGDQADLTTEGIKNLPEALISLKLPMTSDDMAHLPRTLEELDTSMDTFDGSCFSGLPSSLKALTILFWIGFPLSSIQSFPKGLTKLCMPTCYDGDHPNQLLPTSLIELNLGWLKHTSVENLSLKSLKIHRGNKSSLENLPMHLTCLEIAGHPHLTDDRIALLPKSLQKLFIYQSKFSETESKFLEMSEKGLEQLPQGLTFLKLDSFNKSLSSLSFPPFLTHLDLTFERKKSFTPEDLPLDFITRLPKALTTVLLSGICIPREEHFRDEHLMTHLPNLDNSSYQALRRQIL